MRAQVFTMDLVIGMVLILSIIGSAYALSSYYTTLNGNLFAQSDISETFASATSAFMLVNTTQVQIVGLQNGGPSGTFQTYIQNTLGKEVDTPYTISVYTENSYTDYALPLSRLFTYASPTFASLSTIASFNEPMIVTNTSSVCGGSCNFSLSIQSAFPTENTTLNTANCTVVNNKKQILTGWKVFNNTPAGTCTIQLGSPSNAEPNNYLVTGYTKSGTKQGNTTLYVLAFDLVDIQIEI